jgi:type IV pilus assembly protein PilQ
MTLKMAGRELPIATTRSMPSSKISTEQKKCVGKELRIDFTSMPLKATLQVIADYSGKKLVVDPLVSGDGAFRYECVPWDTVLQDIASKHNLVVKVDKGTIFATRR